MDIERQNYLAECEVEDKKKIRNFVVKFGLEDAELAEKEKLECTPNSSPEILSIKAIELGYVWVEKFECWVKKENPAHTKEEKRIANIIPNIK